MLIPNGAVLQKGMAGLKQVVISMVIVLIAAGILAVMVLYTVVVLKAAQTRILLGENPKSIGVIWEAGLQNQEDTCVYAGVFAMDLLENSL